MSVALINNHVLFPHQADWRTLPEWARRWESEISEGVTGAESRIALRTQPRVTLSYTIVPRDPVEQAMLDTRILAAKKSGLACVPYRGRASVLNAECSGSAVELQSDFWPWTVGDKIFFQQPNSSDYEIRTLTAVDGVDLTLNAAVDETYAAGALVWPVLFGKFSCEEMAALGSQRGAVRITVSEQVSPASAQLGEVTPPGGSGIGAWAIGSTFVIS